MTAIEPVERPADPTLVTAGDIPDDDVFADLKQGIRSYRLWWGLAWLDIKMRYRRTVLGPFWLTLSFALSAAAMGMVFGTLFKFNIREFLPYLTAGLSIWFFMAALIIEGCNGFITARPLILQQRMPMTVHVFRVVVRNLLIYLHNLLVVIGVGIVLGVSYNANVLLAVPALMLILLNGLWVGIVLGTASARFRDLPQVVTVLVGVTFFVTPIFWTYEMFGWRTLLADINPLYHFVDVLRAPLLGLAPAPLSWQVTVGCTVVGWAVALAVVARFQRRVPYWV